MLCPEVWNLKCPKNEMDVKKGSHDEKCLFCEETINHHYLNHNVSVTLPNCPTIPEDISKLLKEDCEYYRVKLPLFRFIEKEFIDAFLKPGGEVTALSIGTKIDVDDCASLIPSGHLVLSVCRETYQYLGIEGKPWSHSSAKPDRYAVCIDLKKDCFKPGKPNYDRVLKSFSKYFPIQFDFIIAWEPHDEKICPSTLAKYLHDKGHGVRLCTPKFSYKLDHDVLVPSLENTSPEELLEWLGAYSLGVFKKDSSMLSVSSEEYLSSYRPPDDCTKSNKVVMFQWTGLFTTRKLLRLFKCLRNYLSETLCSNESWISLNVQGFADSPVSWKMKHHNYYINGDNHYTIFLQQEHLMCIKVTPGDKRIK